MDLASYLRIVRRRWWLIVLAVVVTLGAAGFATLHQHKQYRASTRLLVSGASSLSAGDELTERQLAGDRAVAFSQIATTGPAVKAALAAVGNPVGGANVTTVADGKSPFLVISVTSTRAATAQAVANAYVTILPGVVTRLEKTAPSSVSAPLSTLEAAGLPTSPYSPDYEKNLGVGALLGLLLGFGAIVLREALDPSIRDGDALRELVDVHVLGTIPMEHSRDKVVAVSRPHSGRTEAYRRVRAAIDLRADVPPRSMVISSPGQGDGKSSLAVNLAVVAARTGKRVCLVDADLRRPAVGAYLGLPAGSPGLSDLLLGRISLDDVLVSGLNEGLAVLPSGSSVNNPSEILGSDGFELVLRRLEADFDFVIIDTPPLLAVADALVIGVRVDALVLVIRLGSTTQTGVRRALEAMATARAPMIGIVGNAAAEAVDKGYGYGYYSSNARSDVQAVPSSAPILGDAKAGEPLKSGQLRVEPHRDSDPDPWVAERTPVLTNVIPESASSSTNGGSATTNLSALERLRDRLRE